MTFIYRSTPLGVDIAKRNTIRSMTPLNSEATQHNKDPTGGDTLASSVTAKKLVASEPGRADANSNEAYNKTPVHAHARNYAVT